MKNTDAKHLVAAIQKRPQMWATKIGASPTQANGLWDVLACVAGKLVWIELKHGRDKLTRWQERQQFRWSDAGALHIVAGNDVTVDDVLKQLDRLI